MNTSPVTATQLLPSLRPKLSPLGHLAIMQPYCPYLNIAMRSQGCELCEPNTTYVLVRGQSVGSTSCQVSSTLSDGVCT